MFNIHSAYGEFLNWPLVPIREALQHLGMKVSDETDRGMNDPRAHLCASNKQ